jgi:rfaE bifunctional protein nucleotidyltransferase chain/domain
MDAASKITMPGPLAEWRATLPADETLAVVAGSFRILHPGNLSTLAIATRCADHVCLLIEPTLQEADRTPGVSLDERQELVSHLRGVSTICAFANEATLKLLSPYIHVHCSEQGTLSQLDGDVAAYAHKSIDSPALTGCFTTSIISSLRTGATPLDVPASAAVMADGGMSASGKFDPWDDRVTINGCFDVLHVGHLRFLDQAAQIGDTLSVLINSDESVQRYKGPERPVFPETFRAAALSALTMVSGVRIFSEDDPLRILSEMKPDIHVKGGSYEPDRVGREKALLESWGGRLEFCPMIDGYSTTGWVTGVME